MLSQEHGTAEREDRHQVWQTRQCRAKPCHASRYEREISEGAEEHHCPYVLPSEAMPEHESVLRADGNDQRKREAEAGQHGTHVSKG